jgi:hypothetical protein
MRGKVTKIFKKLIVILATFVLMFSFGCTSSPKISDPKEGMDGSWTVLVYMCGSTLESRSGEATKNINEMLQATLPENANVIIQTGGASSWKFDGISASNTDRFKIENNQLVLVDRIEKSNFAASSTLTSFINFGLKNYPADHTALILWDHGGGSIKGVCLDENYGGDTLTLPELSTAIKGANLSQKFDFVGFDACLMATYETASVLAPYAKNLVASEEKEPSGGWNYAEFLSCLGKDDLYDKILSSYAEKSSKKYYTLSVINLSGLGVIDSMISELTKKMKSAGKREIVNGVNYATSFGLAGSGLYDLGNLFEYFDVAGDYSEFLTCVNSTSREQATGMSIYFPLYNSLYVNNYLAISQNSDYSSLIKYFAASDGQTIEFTSYAEEENGKLSFTLNSNSMAYYAEVDYMLFAFESLNGMVDNVFLLGNDNDVALEGNKVTISFEGRWVEFGGKLLSCTILDQVGDYTTYQAPVCVNGEEGMLLFGFNSSTRKTDIIGVTYASEEYGRVCQLSLGDSVLVIKREYVDGEYENVEQSENEFEYTGQSVNVVSLPDGIYQYTAFVRDIYGNTFTAGTAVVSVTDGSVEILTITGDEVYYPDLW